MPTIHQTDIPCPKAGDKQYHHRLGNTLIKAGTAYGCKDCQTTFRMVNGKLVEVKSSLLDGGPVEDE